MNARESHVIKAALAIPERSEPEPGFLDTLLMRAKISISARRYDRQINPIVEERSFTIVNGRLAGDDFARPMESMASGMLFDFPPEAQEPARQRIQDLGKSVYEVAERVVAELRDEIAIRTAGVQHVRDELADKRQLLQQVQNDSVVVPSPEEPESLKRLFKVERALDVAYSEFGRLRSALYIAIAQVVGVLGLETLLVFLSLIPVLVGTPGVTPWMIAAQGLVITAVIVFVAHHVWSGSDGIRGLSAIGLVLISSALAMLRAGVIGSGADGAVSQDPTIWAITFVMAFSGFGLALIGGQASHRATQIIEQASNLREEIGKEVAEQEADLAEWKSNRAHHRNREEEIKRMLPRLEREIGRLETALRSETAEIQQLVQHRVQDAVKRSLSSEITNTASQLARLRHDPKSTNGKLGGPGAVMVLLLGLSLFTGTACTTQNHVQVEHVLLDTSGSISPDVTERMKANVVQAARRWIDTSSPRDEFNVWWLTPEGSSYPADRRTLTMPLLTVPAYASREVFSDEAMSTVEDWLGQLPHRVQRTRLLESLYYIASTQDRRWAITILSDLREDSPNFNSVRASNADDTGLVKAMLELCPTVKISPESVSLVSWPGIVSGNLDGIKEHEHARRLFTMFFERWAPEAEVRLTSI